jgi:hypothetical protein
MDVLHRNVDVIEQLTVLHKREHSGYNYSQDGRLATLTKECRNLLKLRKQHIRDKGTVIFSVFKLLQSSTTATLGRMYTRSAAILQEH